VSPVPRDVMAAEVRAVIERHDEWDGPHEFVTFRWDGEHLIPGTVGVIMPDIDPERYPELMASLAAKDISEHPPDELPCAYLLKIEGFGVAAPPPGATDEERRQFNADRLGRTFCQRADAIEARFYRPGSAEVRGRLTGALLSIAAATGSLMAGAN